MRLWLIWIAISKRNFICFAYNRRYSKTSLYLKGISLFSHLPDKLNDAEEIGLDVLCDSIKKIKEYKAIAR